MFFIGDSDNTADKKEETTKDQQDKMHQGFHLSDQLALKTFVAASLTK